MSRPKVMFLTCHLPFPPVSGGRRREYELLRRIGRDVDVHLTVISKTYDEDFRNARVFDEWCTRVSIFPAVPEPDVANDLSPAEPYQILRHRSQEAAGRLPALLEQDHYDVVHVEAFYLMQHVPPACGVPVFLQEQNIEYDLWRQRTATALNKHERRIALAQYLKTLETEIAAWRRSDLCGAVTPEDRATMQRALPDLEVRLVPDGADHLGREHEQVASRPDVAYRDIPIVGFIANFAYQPNLDAALHLCRDIFPTVQSHVPDARLILAGNSPSPEMIDLGRHSERIVVTGRVNSVAPFLDAADVVVCPLRIGGGIKVKVLEALCRGKAIVTTSVGIQGLPGVEGAVLVEDQPTRFAEAVIRLLMNPRERVRLEAAASAFSKTLPAWDDAAGALTGAYFDLISGRVARVERKRTAARTNVGRDPSTPEGAAENEPAFDVI